MEQERKRKDDVILCVTRAEPASVSGAAGRMLQ